MPDTVSRETLNALLPPGAIWVPAPGADLDLLLDGIGDDTEIMRVFLNSLAEIRTPQQTGVLADLEKEFGIVYNSTLTEQERRDQLAAAKTASQGDGTADWIQAKLIEASFDLQVHVNDPPVDPDVLFAAGFKIYFDDQVDAYFGNEDALFGRAAGSLVVNGGDDSVFSVPASSDYFTTFFFIGGDATRDPGTDELTAIDAASVPVARAAELIRLICKYKPLHQWCGLIISFV